MSKKLYKFLNGMKSEHGGHKWKKDEWYTVKGELKMCENGFHASEYIQDALGYVQGDTLAVVEVDGEHIEGKDKKCWERMRVVKTYDWTKIETLKLAIYSAKQPKEYFDGDKRIIQDCIYAAKKILNEYEEGRDPSEGMIESVRSAESAARSAARSACSAESELSALSATRSAASAARSATRSAASAALSAARSAEWSAKSAVKKEIHEYCLEILRED